MWLNSRRSSFFSFLHQTNCKSNLDRLHLILNLTPSLTFYQSLSNSKKMRMHSIAIALNNHIYLCIFIQFTWISQCKKRVDYSISNIQTRPDFSPTTALNYQGWNLFRVIVPLLHRLRWTIQRLVGWTWIEIENL